MAPRRIKEQRTLRTKGNGSPTYPGERRVKVRRAHNREFNYVLHIRDNDLEFLAQYQDILTQGVASFADIYYNYLFDNPSTAEALYSREREGGNTSDFVRTQLRHFATITAGEIDDKNAAELIKLGRMNHQWQIGPIWVLGAMRLYVEHLAQLIGENLQHGTEPAARLEGLLIKLTYRALGIIMQGYWEAALEAMDDERADSSPDYAQLIDILRNIPLVVWSVSIPSLQLSFASPAARGICPEGVDAPVPWLARVNEDDKERVSMAWEQALAGVPAQAECRADLGVGGERDVRFVFNPHTTLKGKVDRVDGLLEDRTDDRESVARLERMATTDGLTGLANRLLWNDRLERALASIRRNSSQQAVIMVLDLNQFKPINDSFGHGAGDEVLRQVSQRLASALRDSDTVARLGGDEFAVLLPAVEGAQKAGERVANKLQACFEAPFLFHGEELSVSTAIGVAISPEHGEDAETLMQHADVAMYRAKQAELSYLFFHPESDVSVSSRVEFSRQLRGALGSNQFELYYQPKVEIGTEILCGAEALLRWQHPDEGMVLPERFLSLAERTGLMKQITDWVLRTALVSSRHWSADGDTVPVSVNVSTRAFQDTKFVTKVKQALRETEVSGDHLEIEVTENVLMTDIKHGVEVIRQLADMGVAVAVDDFGAGYSSLSFLKQLPVSALKIDKSFLANITEAGNDIAIIRSIIELGHNLGCKVVAEGVESKQALAVLSDMGCDQGQGFHISHPLSERGFRHWMAETAPGRIAH